MHANSPTHRTLTAATVHDDRLTIDDGEATLRFSPYWLRDNCPCVECRIEQTGEHRFFLGAVEQLPSISSVDIVDGLLRVAWDDGHRSEWSAAELDRVIGIADRSHPDHQLWAPGHQPVRFAHDRVINDLTTRSAFFTAVQRDGAAIVEGTPPESGECIRFLESLRIPVRDTPFDRLHDVFFRSDGYNVAHTDEPLPPHNDFASYRWPPSGQLIHFLVNDVAGGESILVDGFGALERLRAESPDDFEVLTRVPVAFREHSDENESWAREPLVRVDSRGEIVALRFSNQLMQPLPPGEPEIDAWYHAYHRLARLVAAPENQVVFRSEPGDMQVLHAQRVLHARTGFDGSSGARHLQDTYFDFDDLAARAAFEKGHAR